MSQAAEIFDRRLQRHWLGRHRAVIRAGDFLRLQVAEDLADRLSVVARRFEHGLLIGAGAMAAAPVLTQTRKIERLTIGEPAFALAQGSSSPTVVLDGEVLPFASQSFDLVVSLLDLQQVNDLPGALVQLRHILKPDGLLLASVIGGASFAELARAFAIAESEALGGVSPHVAPMVDVRDLGQLLQRAGFALPVADLDRLSLTYASPLALMRELKGLGLGNALIARSKRPLRRGVLAALDSAYRGESSGPDGRIAATIEILTATAWSPGPDQQQPLRPGSARARLADALGTAEQPAGERAGPGKEGDVNQ